MSKINISALLLIIFFSCNNSSTNNNEIAKPENIILHNIDDCRDFDINNWIKTIKNHIWNFVPVFCPTVIRL